MKEIRIPDIEYIPKTIAMVEVRILSKDVELLDIREKRSNGMSVADIALETGYSEKTIENG